MSGKTARFLRKIHNETGIPVSRLKNWWAGLTPKQKSAAPQDLQQLTERIRNGN